MKSGSEMGEGEREKDGEAAPAAESEAEGLGDGTREPFCLADVDGRLRGIVDFAPLLSALSSGFEALGRGGENEGRLRLVVVGAISQIKLSCRVSVPGLSVIVNFVFA